MTWTREQLEQIPEVYRHFMLALKPVIDSRDKVLQITAVPFGDVWEVLSWRHEYGREQIRQIADRLKEKGWVEETPWHSFFPTPVGEELIHAFSSTPELVQYVPPLPD
jgi:hypothetical protein